MAKVLYEAALINSGYMIKDTIDFSKRFYRLYNSALGISRDAPIEEYEVELEDEGDSSGDKNDSDSDDEAPPKKNKNALPDDDDVPRDDL
jgi:heat shock protein beta